MLRTRDEDWEEVKQEEDTNLDHEKYVGDFKQEPLPV